MHEEPEEDKISLADYIVRMHELVDVFGCEHRAGNEHDPKDWPLEMRLGDWDEQFLIFMTTESQE
jgi:hypothetical protein